MRKPWKSIPSRGPAEIPVRVLAWLMLTLLLACSPAQPPPALEPLDGVARSLPGRPPPADEFWLPTAQAHLAGLSPHSDRTPGDAADEAARSYLRAAFESAGAEWAAASPGEGGSASGAGHLIARLEGVSRDALVLVAPYSVLGSTSAVDDSGAALLLELARVYSRSRPPYTLIFALAAVSPDDGRGALEPSGVADSSASGVAVRERVATAGRSLASTLSVSPWLQGRVRAVLVFETAARGAGRVARDLRSHPIYRDVFWQTAAVLGHESAFPADAGWSSPVGLQEGLRDAPLGPVLALIDERSARPELGGVALGGRGLESGAQEAAGLRAVGQVSVSALSRLMHQFEKVDAFTARVGPALPR